jgi:hypothetical protein
VIVKAVNCSSGDTIASAEATAADKSHVLDALSKVATDLRGKLGESLATRRCKKRPRLPWKRCRLTAKPAR